nr:MAG TPA: hypothetical protein [Caudoviricetes sp.]
MTPIRSSDHAERRGHCPHFEAPTQGSAWTIRGFAPERRPRLGDAHAEQSASHINLPKGESLHKGDSLSLR